MRSSKLTALAAAFALSLGASAAAAQSPANEPRVTGTGATYSVTFIDDALNALPGDALIPRIVVRRGAMRVMLLRPRTQYVTEMLKSVEGM